MALRLHYCSGDTDPAPLTLGSYVKGAQYFESRATIENSVSDLNAIATVKCTVRGYCLDITVA